MDDARVIGIKNRLPWHLPADLHHFKALTMGKPILMGRNTFESIGKPLPGRVNVIITRDQSYRAAGCVVMHTLDAALNYCAGDPEAMVIGGASLYAQTLPLAQRLYLTLIHNTTFEGDAYFPYWDPQQWQEIAHEDHPSDAKNRYPYSFITLDKKIQ